MIYLSRGMCQSLWIGVTVDMNVALNTGGSLEIKTTKELDLELRLSALSILGKFGSTLSSLSHPLYLHILGGSLAVRLLTLILFEVGITIRS
jgi:hypothetical protein